MTALPKPTDDLVVFLRSLGTAEIDHSGHDFLSHLISVHDLVQEQCGDRELAAAGLFHSIYGTEKFQDFCLPLDQRDRVRDLIGERAERVAWLNCIMDRATFDDAVSAALDGDTALAIRDRVGSPPIPASIETLTDLATVHLFDWLEQVERSEFGWNYRRSAYRQMAQLVGSDAETLYAEVFAREPQRSADAAAGS